jgi:hypothetical protein
MLYAAQVSLEQALGTLRNYVRVASSTTVPVVHDVKPVERRAKCKWGTIRPVANSALDGLVRLGVLVERLTKAAFMLVGKGEVAYARFTQ